MPSYNTNLEEIKSRLDIVDIISEYIPLKKTGQNWKGLCPFHTEKTPSFMVSPSKQIYHCFGCGEGGDIFTFLIKYENISFQEALKTLAKKAGVEIKKSQRHTVVAEEKDNLLNLHRDAVLFYQQSLRQNSRAKDYLKNRGINGEAQKLFSIGYAPDTWNALYSYLLKDKGYKVELIKKAGLMAHGTRDYHDIFRDRIIFPIFNLRGDVIAFGGRVMSELTRSGDDSMPKYLNSSESPIFSKSRVLYGLNLAKEHIRKTGFAIFVEGYLDVITAHMFGFSNAVAPLGTALTHEHGKLIKRFTQDSVLVFDGDESGSKAAKNAIGVLLESGINVRVSPLPEGEDPDSFLRKEGKEAFSNMLKKAMSIVDFYVMQTGVNLHQKGNEHLVAHEALEIISKIPDSVLQGYYVKLLSERVGINELFIREELRNIKKRYRLRNKALQSKSVSGEKDVGISEARSRAKPMGEIYLLQLLLQFPERAKEIFNIVSVEDFEDPATRTIFKKMKEGLIRYNDLISECEGEAGNILTELAFKADFEEPEKIFKDCLNRFKYKKRQILLNELQDKIKKAEFEKNDSLLRALLLEKQKLLGLKNTN